MLVAARCRKNQLDLRRRYVPGIDPADAASLVVDLQHDHRGRLDVMVEVLLKHADDEFHRRVVVVEHDDLVHRRRLGARRLPLHYRGTVVTAAWRHRAGLGRIHWARGHG
jgi:hypothetical protein